MIGFLNRTRIVVAGLAIIALVLGTLIYRDMFVPSKNAASALNLYSVVRRTVTASISGSGNVEPQLQSNVNFKVAGTLTEIDVHVGDHVSSGQKLAAIDPSAQQAAVDQASANLATAQANLQAVLTPLTQNQITQLQNNVASAQQTYNDTVAQVNATNTQDTNQVTADQNQLAADQQTLSFNLTYQNDLLQLSTDKATYQTALTTFNNDATCKGVAFANYSPQCLSEFTAVSVAQTAVANDQAKVNVDTAQVTADQTRLNADTAKQSADRSAGQRSVNQAAASLTGAQDQLRTQTETKPNQIASARAQVANAQAALQTAQQNNGVVGENVAPGGGTTAEAPGSQAPLPGSAASNAFMVIGNISGMDVVVPFAESDASRLAVNQDVQVTFDAVSNLTISGHVIAVASASTNASGVVNYYATIALNQTNKALKQGMTANATVTVSKATNAISVPNLAISRVAGQAYVNVYAGGQQVQTPIETGVVGDQFTEVTGGLNDGAQVVIPTVRVSSGTGNTRGGGGGFGGGGVQVKA
ncbi:MAG: biotin/lipoyl-binding protein [Chloroflexi bacterium]|nr:MAG: biotin/lipoyl-binding protein [Chloroflexota bacterium]